jgi:hypothetical protein
MSKAKAKQIHPITHHARGPVTQLARILVPCDQRGQATAYLLGYRHGVEGLPARKAETFIVAATRTAYTLGFLAGRAARALAKGMR